MSRSFNAVDISNRLKECLPADTFHSLHEPSFQGNEWSYVKECLDTGWVSSVGKFVTQFEEKFAEFTGSKHAIAVVNGTAALHASLMVVGVEPDDEVLVPALTFVATANAVAYCSSVPHFVESEDNTLGIDPIKLREYLSGIAELRSGQCYNKKTGRRIKAVVAMHTFGHPVDLDPLVELCRAFHLSLIEDAAESLGSYYKGMHTGNFGSVAAFSFNGNKVMTTGGGGMVTTNDSVLAKQLKHLTTTAKLPHKWEFVHDLVGYNYRMPNINAALGCAQLEQLPSFLSGKRKLANRYQDSFKSVEGIRFFEEPNFAKSNYWLNVLLLEEKYADQRDMLLAMTNDAQIMTRPAWILMNELEMYRECPRMELTVAERLRRTIINIPSSAHLGGSHE